MTANYNYRVIHYLHSRLITALLNCIVVYVLVMKMRIRYRKFYFLIDNDNNNNSIIIAGL